MGSQLAERPRERGQRITAFDAESIADMMVECRLTETEACHQLKLNPQCWFNWKVLNAVRFNEVLSRVRGAGIKSKIASIKEMGDGITDCKGNLKRDWRAHAWLLERQHPDRFSPNDNKGQTAVVDTTVLATLAAKVYASLQAPQNDIQPAQQSVRQIEQGQVVDVTPAESADGQKDTPQ